MNINPFKVLKIQLILIGVLLVFNCIGIVYSLNGPNTYSPFFDQFNFDMEQNVPTYYSSLALLVAASLLGLISYCQKKLDNSHVMWTLLALIFCYLSVDETFLLHDYVGIYLMKNYSFKGIFHFAWIVPFGLLLLVFIFFYYFKFLLKLSYKMRRLFIISGMIFVLGAVGVEMVNGKMIYDGISTLSLTYGIAVTIEELLEMLGIAFFIYALLLYLKEEISLTISIPSAKV